MRISDWSSDVCSSDLAPQFDVVVIDDGSTDATCEVALREGARVTRPPFNLGIGGAVQSGFSFALDRGYDYQIGSAQCRERVGQYVSISVVAVSLKKKNNCDSETT